MLLDVHSYPTGQAVADHAAALLLRILGGPANSNATPDSCRMVVSMFTPQPARTESARRHWDNNLNLLMKTVLDEDFPVGASIQSNFHSGAQEHVIYGCNEPALAYYHQTLREALGAPEPRSNRP